jgi:putative transposase
MCKVLKVSRSGFYAWVNAGPNRYAQANRQLDVNIRAIFNENKGRYGAPRITKALRALNIKCGLKRVANRMRTINLKALAKRKFKATTDSAHKLPVFDNVLDRDFKAQGINQKWTSDITYISTKEGWLYLAVIIDLFSRAIIGWSMSTFLKKELVCSALTMALFRRKFPKNVIVHSDRGSQYCSHEYRKMLKQNSLIGSMSRKGNCWDNAPSESLFHTLKVELVQSNIFENRDEAKQQIFNYIEGYYNKKRIHSAIDYKTPYEMECA